MSHYMNVYTDVYLGPSCVLFYTGYKKVELFSFLAVRLTRVHNRKQYIHFGKLFSPVTSSYTAFVHYTVVARVPSFPRLH